MPNQLVQLEGTLAGVLLVTDGNLTPVQADALPTFDIYGPDGRVEGGTVSQLHSGSITGATNASPIVITSASHGLSTGQMVTVTGVGGNTAANTTATITKVDANSFSLDGTTGNGAYTSGGTWVVTGLYRYSITALSADGYEVNEPYDVLFSYAVSSTDKQQLHTFQVT